MNDLYTNLLKATDNTNDITVEKYGVITKISGNLCSIKEYDTELEHSNVPIINGAKLEIGDKVVIGFLNNSIYDTVCYGVLDRQIETNWEDIKDKPTTFPTNWENIEDKPTTFPPTQHNHISSEVTDLINTIYPVGSIYMSVNDVNPTTLFGGIWERIQDRFLLAKGSTYTTLEGTGGSATVSLTQSEMPRHTHTQNSHSHEPSNTAFKFLASQGNIAVNTPKRAFPSTSTDGHHFVYTDGDDGINEYDNTNSVTATNKYTGGRGTSESASNGASHENMPPYLVVNIWKRIA